MNTKNTLVEKVIGETLEKLKTFAKTDNRRYQSLLKDLIIEGMVKLLEPVCIVRVRQSDISYVKTILKECENQFGQLMLKETESEFKCQLLVDESEYLGDQK